MKSPYETIFAQILDPNKPNPTVLVNNPDHLPRLRAGLNRCRKSYRRLADFTGEDTLTNSRFKYIHSKDKSKVTISLVTIDLTEFTLCE